MIAKIRAAVSARNDPDLIIMARTDALAVTGIDDAIRRANRYHEAGADLVFVEAPETVDQMRRICREVHAPTFANMLPGGKTPLLTVQELQDIGYAVVADPVSCTYAIVRAVREVFAELRRTGTPVSCADRLVGFDEFNRLVGLETIRAEEKKYYSPPS
jgi:methylisocitrate lyase